MRCVLKGFLFHPQGYEIVRDAAGNVVHSQEGAAKGRSPHDFDDGNEADVEDLGELRRKKRAGRNLNSVRFGSVAPTISRVGGDDRCEQSRSVAGAEVGDRAAGEPSHGVVEDEARAHKVKATPGEEFSADARGEDRASRACRSSLAGRAADKPLGSEPGSSPGVEAGVVPVTHIDSIHSRSYSLGEAILSQHASLPSPADTVPGPGSSANENAAASCGREIGDTVSVGDPGNLHNVHNHHHDDDDDEDNDDDIEDYMKISAVDDDSNDNYDDDDDDDDDGAEEDNNDDHDNDGDNDDDDEEKEQSAGPVRSHQRIIDKERIKSWLESQTTVVPED
ncbi:hypothetical protein EGW08_020402 [Elysia chlorotica]|uniref:Uncharacterized protein n=1 Tax=Elysia chlorotica TaxID=188477 RepID=A0A3S1B0G1_ELYCH|nr:hypothetical protein EGW08_020402 [Elysia chlorotica]